MEIKFLNFEIKIKREEGPTRNQIWGILKYLSAEFSLKIRDWSGSDGDECRVKRHVSVTC